MQSRAPKKPARSLNNIFSLDGYGTLVTGASSGLGRAIAHGLATFGANVALLDIQAGPLQQLEEKLSTSANAVIAIPCDVTDEGQVRYAVDRANEALGKLDGAVLCAGISRRSAAEAMRREEWDEVLEVNLTGVFLAAREIGKGMIDGGEGGSIVTIASIAGQVGITTGNVNYAASKGGVIALTRTLAMEWAPHGIRVNAIAPTHFRTPLASAAIEEDPTLLDYFVGNIPLGRLGEPWELVGPAVFLLSEASSMVTGHVLNVDGGHTAR